jgi:nucleotide-binding universal stress UspA family protein
MIIARQNYRVYNQIVPLIVAKVRFKTRYVVCLVRMWRCRVMVELKRILYPSDFSEHSLAALPYALELCRRFDAQLYVLHVVDDAYQYWMASGEGTVPVVVSEGELLGSARQQMTKFIDEHLAAEKQQIVTKLAVGKPFVEIIRYARDQSIDMIVIASHGHGALTSMLMGSVTEKVVRKSSCPVLTIRHGEHKFEMP